MHSHPHMCLEVDVGLAAELRSVCSLLGYEGAQAWCLDWAKHADMAHAYRAPMSFFHTTPLGRIINRLTKDTVDADKNLADFAAFFLRSMLQLVSTVVLIGIVTPLALPALLPIMLLFYFLYAYFQVRSYLTLPPQVPWVAESR